MERVEDFVCSNTALLPYNPDKCPPPRKNPTAGNDIAKANPSLNIIMAGYGRVQNVRSDWASEDDESVTLELSWAPPAEHQEFHASHDYHLTLTPDTPHDHPQHTHTFIISSDGVSH